MSTDTKIEWADKTWSPILGCDRVGPGCDHCYAIRTVHRLSSNPHPKIGPLYKGLTHRTEDGLDWTGKIRTIPERLGDPLKWRKPLRVFVNSQSDLFHADVPDEFIARVFAVMARCPQHTFQILTKRHARMRSLLSSHAWWTQFSIEFLDREPGTPVSYVSDPRGPYLSNVHLGVSVEDQRWADIRIPALLQTPAAVRWVSAEPLLGPIDLMGDVEQPGPAIVRTGCSYPTDYGTGIEYDHDDQPGIDWVVVGGESGPGARPMALEWAQGIVDQCKGADVPVLVKQLGSVTGGKSHQDITTFPPGLRVREYPTVTA